MEIIFDTEEKIFSILKLFKKKMSILKTKLAFSLIKNINS